MMMLDHVEEPNDEDDLAFILYQMDMILACCTNELGPASVVKMLREKADLIEAISQRRMH